ncbi:MAG: pentapeptide repeat-containing protein [Haliscomenobacteraceae bacterium CHB4]|nr:pentapeptide repeat-containing protein [Haliscomenobacteraceae bacterium CHB4]
MANAEHLEILKSGVEKWNKWREKNNDIKPDLSKADLSKADLSHANLSYADFSYAGLSYADLSYAELSSADLPYADLSKAKLSYANLSNTDLSYAKLSYAKLPKADLYNTDLSYANLSYADLSEANLYDADLSYADLSYANLSEANLFNANLYKANLSEAKLSKAKLLQASFVKTFLSNANIEGSKVFGISAWGIKKDGLIQRDLVITEEGEAEITVDNLEVAQFIYLMLNNQNIRDVIDTLTSKTVLILGRFSDARKPLLEAIKDELRKRNYLPILFDFEKPASRDLTETISILARMSRFVIADLTDAKSIPQELSHFVPDTSLPVVPIILEEQQEYGMFESFKKYHWVLPIYQYEAPEAMLTGILENIIESAERKVEELRMAKK